MISDGIRETRAPQWHPVSITPARPMVVLFYSQNCVWHDQHGNECEWPLERDEKYSLGFWDGEWCWMGTGHGVFEIEDIGHPDLPSHWSPLPPPPVGSGSQLADATNKEPSP